MPTNERVQAARIGELDQSPVCPVESSTATGKVVTEMKKKGIGSVLVVEKGKLVGIFTERDLFRKVLAGGHPEAAGDPVSKWMTPKPETVLPDAPIGEVIRKMNQGGYRHLPVVDADGRPVAMLSVKNIVHWLVEHYPTSVLNLPPDPSMTATERDGA